MAQITLIIEKLLKLASWKEYWKLKVVVLLPNGFIEKDILSAKSTQILRCYVLQIFRSEN